MHFTKISDKRVILSDDHFNKKWSGSSTLSAVNLGKSYTIKCSLKIHQSVGISLDDFELKYLKNGSWSNIANGYDINNIIMEDIKSSYDSFEFAFDEWISICKKYIVEIEDGL